MGGPGPDLRIRDLDRMTCKPRPLCSPHLERCESGRIGLTANGVEEACPLRVGWWPGAAVSVGPYPLNRSSSDGRALVLLPGVAGGDQ